MSIENFHGVFRISFNSCQTDAQAEKHKKILLQMFDGSAWHSYNGWYDFDKKEEQYAAKDDVQRRRDDDAYHRRVNKLDRYSAWTQRYYIHKCDGRANWLVSKSEAKAAVKFYLEKKLNFGEKFTEKVLQFAKENKISVSESTPMA